MRNPSPCHQFVYNLAQQRWTHIKCFVEKQYRFTRRPAWNGSLTNSCFGNCSLKFGGVQIERFEGLGVPGKLQGSGSGCERCAGWRFQAKEKRRSKAFTVRVLGGGQHKMATQPYVSISVLTSVVLCARESPLTFLPDVMTHSLPQITFHSNPESARRMEAFQAFQRKRFNTGNQLRLCWKGCRSKSAGGLSPKINTYKEN